MLSLVDIGIQCSLRQLLVCAAHCRTLINGCQVQALTSSCCPLSTSSQEHGFFHADPHPGNLLATPQGKLAFIDFGMMSDTPATAR